jgi:hypothetical protein
MLLPMVSEVYLKAEEEGALLRNQEHVARICKILIRGLARTGIIALVDEATGFQDDRARDALQQILNAYIAEELRPWTKTFPQEFFRQVYRLHNWQYKPGTAKRTPFVGKLINKYVYDKLPEGVLDKLRTLNPVLPQGYRRHKHFQFLTDEIGNPHLSRQILAVTTIMKVSDDQKDFEENFAKVFPQVGEQVRLPLVIKVPPKGDR